MSTPIRNSSGNSRHGPPPEDDLPLGHTGEHHRDVEPKREGLGSPARRRLGEDPMGQAPSTPAESSAAAGMAGDG